MIPKEQTFELGRFFFGGTKWNVFQIHHEWVRSCWVSDSISCMFFGNTSSEREAIQRNNCHLNNLIIQSSSLPVGYPAYVSAIRDSTIEPLKGTYFEKDDE